jgi:glucan phosphoethanolaminetransferase (alkaline phosphatase superfamily)
MWRKDRLLLVILWWTALVAGILVWLPLVRGATQGSAYRWALTTGIGGRGVGGDYWLLIPGAAFVLSVLYLGWRGGRRPFHWLLLAFHVPLAIAVTYAAWIEPRGLRFEGATVDADISLAVIGPVLFCGFAILSIVWVLRDLRARRSRELAPWVWTRSARVRLLLLVAMVPIEMVLFRSGGIQSIQNLIGVGLVGWQWVLLNRLLAGARRQADEAPSSSSCGHDAL